MSVLESASVPPTATSPASNQVLLVECSDCAGLVHGITGVLYQLGVNVIGNQEFVDGATRTFYMRTEFEGEVSAPDLLTRVREVLPPGAQIRFSRLAPKRVVVLASREHHCLADILIRHTYREFNATVLAVVANHPDLGELAARFAVPFHLVESVNQDRLAHECAILALLAQFQPDFIVLAKYMRVLSPEFCARYPAQIINIHHSFLPAFVGARPYHQAFARGVKVIGATAHFVTPELDAGAIITQEVLPVNHSHTPADLRLAGRDVEQIALARALKLVFEDRVFLCANRTVIFD